MHTVGIHVGNIYSSHSRPAICWPNSELGLFFRSSVFGAINHGSLDEFTYLKKYTEGKFAVLDKPST